MAQNSPSKEVMELLLGYLPKLSISINTLMKYLHTTLEQEKGISQEYKEEIQKELLEVIPMISNFYESVEYKRIHDNIQAVALDDLIILRSHGDAMGDILNGLGIMLDWVKGIKDEEKDIKEAINFLYSGTQKIMKVVNDITEKK
ncbi:hypothetical protein IMZ78_12980 [Bacillus anthracis]|uniref:hypothetical protein n=1 Tax=Bacillus anthracis TaxID=1392 RepID=UPI0018692FF1|nr:hypothetical protein [Bacillus anthracis]MBE3643204.1 hypothetical protein [Bacillus anthracis]